MRPAMRSLWSTAVCTAARQPKLCATIHTRPGARLSSRCNFADPLRQIGFRPIALHHAYAVGDLALKPGLPVVGAAAVKTGNDECRVHVVPRGV